MKRNCTNLKPIISTLTMVLVISACNSFQMPVPTRSATDTPVPVPPTPALEPAENYVIGASEIPTGMYLFITADTYDECAQGKCGCPVVEAPRWVYEWSSDGNLYINPSLYQEYFSNPGNSSISFLGLFGYGQWRDNLSAITALPYTESGITIYSVDADGVMVINLQGKPYLLKPGQSWLIIGSYESYAEAGCSIRYETRLTNYGLLNRQQIRPEE